MIDEEYSLIEVHKETEYLIQTELAYCSWHKSNNFRKKFSSLNKNINYIYINIYNDLKELFIFIIIIIDSFSIHKRVLRRSRALNKYSQ